MEKENILQEIRRTATAEGLALGRKKFEYETGIREVDWRGKHWINWSDAVKEAGCLPNQFNPPTDKSMMLQKAAELIRELGHFPRRADLAFKRNNDPTFPNETSYRRRFGKKEDFAAAIYSWCNKESGWIDVSNICEGVKNDSSSSSSISNKTNTTTRNGFVYLMKSGKYYKIGKTNSIDRRQYEIGLQLPEGIEPIHSIETDDPSGIEAYWHNRFREKRKKGEWFFLNKADVKIFKKRRFM